MMSKILSHEEATALMKKMYSSQVKASEEEPKAEEPAPAGPTPCAVHPGSAAEAEDIAEDIASSSAEGQL